MMDWVSCISLKTVIRIITRNIMKRRDQVQYVTEIKSTGK